MSRRRSARRPRRVQVNFWRQGDPHPYTGFTANISMTGMFITTHNPQPGGCRVRVEVLGERSFVVEGVVAHARKVRGELARVAQSGMGVRFLAVEELVRELLPSPDEARPGGTPAPAPTEEEAFSEETSEPVPAPVAAPVPPPPVRPVPPPAARPVPSVARPVPPPSSVPPAPPLPPVSPMPSARPVSPPSPAAPTADSGVFSVRFPSPRHFVDVFERDIKNGGLFVATRYPGRLAEVVSIELHPPEAEPILVRARVVQRFEPQGASLLSGMGVELLEAQTLCERLRPIVARLSGR